MMSIYIIYNKIIYDIYLLQKHDTKPWNILWFILILGGRNSL